MLTRCGAEQIDGGIDQWHCAHSAIELQTKVHEDLTITEKAPTRGFSWLKAQ